MSAAVQKTLFLAWDGVVVAPQALAGPEPYTPVALVPGVIPALLGLRRAGFALILVTDPEDRAADEGLLAFLASQGVRFDAVRRCDHGPGASCQCRKPGLGLVREDLWQGRLDRAYTAVVGGRRRDLEFGEALGVKGYQLGESPGARTWDELARTLSQGPRRALVERRTRETRIRVAVGLGGGDAPGRFATGLGFFDHMLEQLARHGGLDLEVTVDGDLQVDEHHTVEDTALALGEALRQALGDRVGIERYGFTLPMDEVLASAALDLSGRPGFVFKGEFTREQVGALPTELVPHFFHSLAQALGATLHLAVSQGNAHHQVEGLFKAFARALRQATRASGEAGVPSTKGVL